MTKIDKQKFEALVAELEAIVVTDSVVTESKHAMVFAGGLAQQIREVGLISEAVPEQASNQTELNEFYQHCKLKLEYLDVKENV